jgi:hypothetical protein
MRHIRLFEELDYKEINPLKRVKNIEYKEMESIPWKPDINFG